MNALTQTDLQTYLHRLIGEHLPPKLNAKKRDSQNSAARDKQTTKSNWSAKHRGDNR